MIARGLEGGLGTAELLIDMSIGRVPVRMLDEYEHSAAMAASGDPIERAADIICQTALRAVGGRWASACIEDAADFVARLSLTDIEAMLAGAGFVDVPALLLAGALVEIERRSSSARLVGSTVSGGRRHTRGGRWK